MKTLPAVLSGLVLCACTSVLPSPACAPPDATTAPRPAAALRASYLITVADDFVVEVYHNGQRVPDARREMLLERFGAMVEKVTIAVRAGDWLVFHVVNNRLRWGGAKYFAVAGCVAGNEFIFASDPASPLWSVCDDPGRVRSFIETRDTGLECRASAIATPWNEGDGFMRSYAGQGFPGRPLFGGAPSTWIKCLVE